MVFPHSYDMLFFLLYAMLFSLPLLLARNFLLRRTPTPPLPKAPLPVPDRGQDHDAVEKRLPPQPAMLSTARFPQELWDEIIDQMAGNFDEHHNMAHLKCASLAARCFVQRAQIYIFRSISIQKSPPMEPIVHAERLLDVMAWSPHLIPYVQYLHVHAGDSRSLYAIAQVAWSNGLQLTLTSVKAAAGSIALESVAKLVGLPSLRGIVFSSGEWDATHLCNIFASCTSAKRLTFVQCQPGPLVAPFVPPTMPDTLVRPECVAFTASNPMIDLVLESTCPVDLSALTHLKLVELDSPRMNAFLSRVGGTLTRLHLKGNDPKLENLNFDLLPNLTQIDAFQISEPFIHFLGRLPPTNCIETINVFNDRREMVNTHSMGTISKEAFETAILEASLPVLKRVNVQIQGRLPFPGVGTWFSPWVWEDIVRDVEASLPRLFENGLLGVELVPFHGSTVFW
ncbi:hypothetical protein FB45DRAFT_1145008 [Roridomyces roridus]|uniref:Uncharacterized protein n=1 Tax=Roridomyces roridus TaxID=1738132 RepID=A0AAD7AZ96_9AGAR|nr:hypothetical protein FB45DRAFT_1145008 [Roridomyces roridus]